VAEESITSFVKHREAYLDGDIRVDTVTSTDKVSNSNYKLVHETRQPGAITTINLASKTNFG
jgi:hypothetical protein